MSRTATRAIRNYETAISPKSVKANIISAKRCGISLTAADVRWSAAMTLRETLDAEMAR